MIRLKIKRVAAWERRGDYVVSEVDEHFFPRSGSAREIWNQAGVERLSPLRRDSPMNDYETRTTSAFNLGNVFPGGIIHLKLPHFPPSSQDEANRRLRKCYDSVLKKAVEEQAMTVVFPFIACISVNFSTQHGINIALQSIRDFIAGTDTGNIAEIAICTNDRSIYNEAISHQIYKEEKRKQKSSIKPSIVHGSTEGTCVFKKIKPNFVSYPESRVECNNQFEKLSQMSCNEPIFGCEHAVDLLLLRGGIQIDWADTEKVLHVGGKRPETTRRLQKSDTLDYIFATGRFIHVGSAICSTHNTAIKERKYDKISFASAESKELVPDEFTSMNDLNTSLSEIEANLHTEVDVSFDHEAVDSSFADEIMDSVTGNIPLPPEEYRDNPENQRRDAIRKIATLFGVDRLTGSKLHSWKTLKPETQRKKVNGMIHLHNELYKACAGECWEEMKDSCLRKMKIVEKDRRVEAVMDVVGQCLEDSNEKTVRISVLKLLTGIFTEKEIRSGTGASRYLIRLAKLSSYEEIGAVTSSFKRERYNKKNSILYLQFLARPEILIHLPSSCKKITLDSGNEAAIAAVARMYSYREIYKLFLRYCEELARLNGFVTPSDVKEFIRVNALGYSSAYKLMETLAPNRQLRMSCIDAFQADAYDAYVELSVIVDELVILDEIDMEKAMELRRRIRVSKNFLFGEMRYHIVQESEVISHCWTHALCDSNDPRFDSPCTHSHDKSCSECDEVMSLPSIMTKIVGVPCGVAKKNKSPNWFRLDRMLQIVAESDKLIRAYRKHLVRCVASEHDRRKIIDELEDGHALIVADYAMKILPTDYTERQSQWYAKGGISFHMSATLARINGELVSHDFSHVSSVSKQDSAAVSGIIEHVLKILKENGISHVHIRTDNAGTYHSAALTAYLLYLSDQLKITVLSHIFSEPQFGKGRADRAISLVKGKLNSYIDSNHSACTPDEIITGFTHNILLKGCSFYIIEVTQSPTRSAALNGIKTFSSFRFENMVGVRVRRHDSIGEGMIVKKESLPPSLIKSTIHRNEGYLSLTKHFWKQIGSAKDNVEEEEEVEETEPAKEEKNRSLDYLRCPDMLCQSRFKTDRGLERHMINGNHKYYKDTQTFTDFGVKVFANLLETTEDAQIAVHADSIVPLGLGDHSEERKKGWALRTIETRKILPIVKKEVEKLIVMQLDGDRRAEAKEIKEQLREAKNIDGSYKFHIDICLSESQVKTQITRIVNSRKKKSEGNDKMNGDGKVGKVETIKQRKRKEQPVSKKNEKKKRGRSSKSSSEEEKSSDDDEENDNIEFSDEEISEEQLAREAKDNFNCLELMERVVEENRHVIFDCDSEFEEEL